MVFSNRLRSASVRKSGVCAGIRWSFRNRAGLETMSSVCSAHEKNERTAALSRWSVAADRGDPSGSVVMAGSVSAVSSMPGVMPVMLSVAGRTAASERRSRMYADTVSVAAPPAIRWSLYWMMAVVSGMLFLLLGCVSIDGHACPCTGVTLPDSFDGGKLPWRNGYLNSFHSGVIDRFTTSTRPEPAAIVFLPHAHLAFLYMIITCIIIKVNKENAF